MKENRTVARRRDWRWRCLALLAWLAMAPAMAMHVQDLATNWEFRLAPDDAQAATQHAATQWRSATVPGVVHTDLLAHRLIPDPYVGAPEAGLQWIGLAQWEYRSRFDVDAATLKRPRAELVFEGLDTFAEVHLNGEPLLSADNSHRTWRVPVQGRLRAGGNELRVVFHSPIRRLLPQVQVMPHKIAGNYPSPYGDEPKEAMVGNFVRKPGYHFGWDWGPRYVTAGIWRPVRLESWERLRTTDLAVHTLALDADWAELKTRATIESEGPGHAQLELDVLDPDGRRVDRLRRFVELRAGIQQVDLRTVIERPRRWWPAGLGEQARYRFRLRVKQGGRTLATAERVTGLRSVELRRETDDDGGQGFAFVVNGMSIFAKGANVIPFDAFPSRVDEARLRQVLQAARDANMNMLRNWGGGYYESDAFYEIADELGLLVWQDFMFGGGMQPGYDPAFRANVVAEARDNVRRLRHHPSIVLWCGNNEQETAWKDWGHRRQLTAADPVFADQVWQGYVDLFGHDLRRVVAEEGLGVPYWSSSPGNDLDEKANDSRRGDKHYWDVWGGPALPVQAFLEETPRFMSEFGLQSWPSLRTIDGFARPQDQGIDTPVIRAHQKFLAGDGNQRQLLYIEREYGTPRDFADFVYLGQTMQAEGIELAALHHRASRPYTMGSLYWQLNDVWPGASWSNLDYHGRWKPLHHHARRFFAEVAVAPLRRDGVTRLHLLSDRAVPLELEWRLRVMDFDGRVHRELRRPATLAPLSAQVAADFSDDELLGAADPLRSVAVFELLQAGGTVSRHLVYFDAAKRLQLPDPRIRHELVATEQGAVLRLHAQAVARAVWIDFGNLDVVLSDNALGLLPGEPVEIQLQSSASLESLRGALRVRSLADAIQSDTPRPHGP
ncbi:hypothetical protein OK348_15770 [Flavobacterium sp. MXW15]|uniref:Beta-mannosidase n=1 Tax=Xanthomonas chitinilytica TaxID=2989819 RepID=A0ABT3JZN9_9XANT|nr:glycoside hydrolase family 2 protein [Xanthomonas sp. H13-6]MCW4456247.1 hypothetical protein [Flavobacterium sp. MXW15]MCW4473952.1 glycoside hydrolase family 2 protein [Xanthomonas sp. H13-6]